MNIWHIIGVLVSFLLALTRSITDLLGGLLGFVTGLLSGNGDHNDIASGILSTFTGLLGKETERCLLVLILLITSKGLPIVGPDLLRMRSC